MISINFDGTVASYLLLIKVIGNFNGAISNLTGFLNQNNQHETNYNSYLKFFSELTYKDPPINILFVDSLKIIDCKISHGGFSMQMNINELTIKYGDNILVQGPSGGGKTTFINALMGKIDGITFDKDRPENFYHVFVEMFQNIRE